MRTNFLPIILCICIFPVASQAQFKKGDILLGGSFSGGFGSVRSSAVDPGFADTRFTNTNANFSPRISFAIRDNKVLGFRTGILVSRNNNNNQGTDKQLGGSLGVFLRQYYPFKDKFGWSLEYGASFSASRYRSTNSVGALVNTTRVTGANAGIFPGIFFRPSERVIINADFGGLGGNYNWTKTNGVSTNNNGSIYLTLFNYYNFGFDIILGKKRKS
jgi:hypothetical protein